jgi:aryl-alcohol dehydrogenase-like predicted oxidoreductase
VLDAAAAASVVVITRVVDYGGLFHDDVRPGHDFAEHDHRRFRPAGWVAEGAARLERMRPFAERNGLTALQLACAWNLSHDAVASVAPTLIQESGAGARPIEDKRAELAAIAGWSANPLGAAEADAIREIGDNAGCMALKGASAAHSGEPRPDRWALDDGLQAVAARWGIDPTGDLGERVAVGTHDE